jgi:hypothetical protein
MLSILSWIFWVIRTVPINGEDVVIAGLGRSYSRRKMCLDILVMNATMVQRHSLLWKCRIRVKTHKKKSHIYML